MISVTAVVCTYNRSKSLLDTLKSLSGQRISGDLSFGIVVIDNNSKDETRAAVDAFAKECAFALKYVLETRQGIGFARNRGLEEAISDYVLFIDDDAVADPDWIARMVNSFTETGADFIGGKIEPLWLVDRPDWVSDDLLGPVVRLDYGPVRLRAEKPLGFLTANVGFRKSSVKRFGPFDASLGRKAERWIGGEDFELCERWFEKGAAVVYEPSAIVKHKVEPSRMSPEFYRKWYEDIGYTQGHQLKWKPAYYFTVIPVWRWLLLLKSWAALFITRLSGNQKNKLRAEIWWRFQSSFFRERAGHWAQALGIKCNCEFEKIKKM